MAFGISAKNWKYIREQKPLKCKKLNVKNQQRVLNDIFLFLVCMLFIDFENKLDLLNIFRDTNTFIQKHK